ncbi:MAG: glycosyltransferase family 2 protein [Patescibacteria group bacterium]|jgi:glycosyltransferase involved in cell wall biosynthesis
MKLTVIITSYNNEKYLEECLESVLNQTYQPFEIIIIDDKSTDNSLPIIEKYKNNYKNIKAIYNEKNLGVTITRHLAIKEAQGDHITTLDGDDFYINNRKIENEINILKENQNAIPFSKIVLVDLNGKRIEREKELEIKDGYILNQIISRKCMIPRDFILSKEEYFNIGGYDKDIKIYEDWDLKIRLATKNEYIYSNEEGTAYRRHGSGLSSNKEQSLRYMKKVFKKNIGLVKNRKGKNKIKCLFYKNYAKEFIKIKLKKLI